LRLAVARLTGLDRGLVHRDDVARADRGQLGVEDGFEQLRALLHELRQPGPAERQSCIEQALVLAIQRQVVAELVDQQSDDASSTIGTTALDDAHRRRCAMQGLRVETLDDGPHVFEDDEAPRALRQPMADLLADDLVLLGRKTLRLGAGHLDGLHRHHGLVEERGVAALVGEVAASLAARVRRHGAAGFGLLGRCGDLVQQLPEMHLLRVGFEGEALAPFAQNPCRTTDA